MTPTNLRKRSSEPLLEKAELPHIRFHDLRHTCATLLFWSTINPKIVSEMLGHANVAITLDTYAHVLPTMQDNATRALEDCSRRRVALVGCSTVAVRGPEYVLGSLLNSLCFICKRTTLVSGADGIRTPDLHRAKAARYIAGAFWRLQICCKQRYFS